MQQYAVWFILLQNHSTCFACPPHPPSGVLKTVTAASGTGHNIGTATSLQRGQVGTWPRWREVLMNFRGFPPGCGDSVADFWGWDAHEARLRCPDDVSGDMQEDEIPGRALSLNLLTTQTMVTTGIFPCKEKFPW